MSAIPKNHAVDRRSPHFRLGPEATRSAGEHELKAPPHRYRVIAVEPAEDATADYLLGDFESLRAATDVAKQRGGTMRPAFVYDDAGKMLAKFGSY
jgi:hypothetical protein